MLVEDFIYSHEGNQREIMLFIHNMMMAHPGVTHKIRYRVPFYYRKSWMCYLNPRKGDKVAFNFIRGNELSNAQGILESLGRKQVMSITFGHVNEIPVQSLEEVIQEAMLLDETTPYGKRG